MRAIRRPLYSNGAGRDPVGTKPRPVLLGSLLVLMAAAAGVLNAPMLFFEPLAGWVRILVPLLLLAGYVGTLQRNQWLRVAGWVGIALFAFVTISGAKPGEDYTLGAPAGTTGAGPHVLDHATATTRLLCFLLLTVALIAFYWLSGRVDQTPKAAAG
jgi:hypothetical protein